MATVIQSVVVGATGVVFARIEGYAGSLIQLALVPLESRGAGAADALVHSAAFPAV